MLTLNKQKDLLQELEGEGYPAELLSDLLVYIAIFIVVSMDTTYTIHLAINT